VRTSHASHRNDNNRGGRFSVPNLDLCRRRWHPAKAPGVLRIASSVLHILPQTKAAPHPLRRSTQSEGERQRRNVSARNVSGPDLNSTSNSLLQFFSTGNGLQKLNRKVRTQNRRTHGIQQARINSRNQTTIATPWKHRQLIVLGAESVQFSNCHETTHWHGRADFGTSKT